MSAPRTARAAALLLVMALLAAACTGSDTSGGQVTTTSVPSDGAVAGTTSTTGRPTTTTVPIGVNPLTDREITSEELLTMPLRALSGSLVTYELAAERPESNARLAQLTVIGSADERTDIDTWSRVDGARTVLTSQVTSAIPVVETWVSLFETDAGAEGYLLDFPADVEKRQDSGRKGSIRVLDASAFAVDPIGDRAVGITSIQESSDGDGHETVIGFRVGRVLGFVSLLATDDRDLRVTAQQVAEDLTDRIEGVLRGEILPPSSIPPPSLRAYTFRFEQVVSETFLVTVFPDFDPFDLDEPDPDDTTTTTAAEGTTTTSLPEETTTTTTRIERRTSTGRVTAQGTVVGDDLGCRVVLEVFGIEDAKDYITVGAQTWLRDATTDDAYREVERDEAPAATDLIYCPGWSPSPADSGLDAILVPGTGVADDLDGLAVERFDLDREALVAIGFAPSADVGPDLDEFTVWLNADPDEPWVVGLELRLSGTTRQFERALGPGFTPDADIVMEFSLRLGDLDDPDLSVQPPSPDQIGDVSDEG